MNFFQLLLAHIIGDVLFQNKWIAHYKRQSIDCVVQHALLYTLGVFICLWKLDVRLLLVFLSHFIIDYFVVSEYLESKFKVPKLVGLLTDQKLHLMCLAGIYYFL